MSEPQPKPGEGDLPNNPFATRASPHATPESGKVTPPNDIARWLSRANRRHWQMLIAGIVIFAIIAGGACWFIYDLVQTAQRQLQSGQNYTSETARRTILESSNYLMQTRLLAQQVALQAQQTRKDREWFTSMQVDSANQLTNTALELRRQLSRQLSELAQTNLARLNQSHAAILTNMDQNAYRIREELKKTIEEWLGVYDKKFQRYEPLLKIDPDIAPRIENALAQLQKIQQRQERLELVSDGEIKSLKNELRLLSEKLKLLETKLELLTPQPTNAPPRTNTPPPPG